MIIAIDLDKTLFNCHSVLYKIVTKLEANKVAKKLVYKVIDSSKESKIGFLKFVSRAFNPNSYKEIEDSINSIKNWTAQGHKIIFLSSRPHQIKALKYSAINWLNKNNVPFDSLVLGCKNKGEFCSKFNVDVLIDDSLNNCKSAVNNNVNAICFKKQEKINNKHYNGSHLFFAKDWKSIDFFVSLFHLEKLKNNPLGNITNDKFSKMVQEIVQENLGYRNTIVNQNLFTHFKEMVVFNNGKQHVIKSNYNKYAGNKYLNKK